MAARTLFINAVASDNSGGEYAIVTAFDSGGLATDITAVFITAPLTAASFTDVISQLRTAATSWATGLGYTVSGFIDAKPDLATTTTDGLMSAADKTKLNSVGSRTFGSPTLTLNSARQASTTQDAFVSVSVEQAATISLTTGQTCLAILQYADNSGFTVNVVEIGRSTNGNTGTLTIGLNLTQTNTATISGMVPANKWYRILTSGTGTQTFRSAQEVLL